MPNNNVAILSLMAKIDEKSIRESAAKYGKTAEEAMSNVSSKMSESFGEELTSAFTEALKVAAKKLKGVNLSSYTGNILDSLFSEKDVKEKAKDLEIFIKNITNLSKSLTGLNPNSLNSINTKQLDAVIAKQEKILDKEQEIANRRKFLENTANNISSKNGTVQSISKKYLSSDYEKSNENLKKLFATEQAFNKDQEKSIRDLSKILTLYSDMAKINPEKGTTEAIRYNRELLTIVQEINKQKAKVDDFTSGAASKFISDNFQSINSVNQYSVESSKQDFIKEGLKSLNTQKAKAEKALTDYIVNIVQKNLQNASTQAEAVIDKATKKTNQLQSKINTLKGDTSSQQPLIGNIIDESQLKTLDEIESRLYEIYDKDAEGNANTEELKEFISLYKQYESLIATDTTRKLDPDFEDEYNMIVNTDEAMRKYAESIRIVNSEKKKMTVADGIGDSSVSEHAEQLKEQEQQAKKTATAENELSEAQQKSIEEIKQDLETTKREIEDLSTRLSSLETDNSFSSLSIQVKTITEDITTLANKVNELFNSIKNTKEINALDVLMHGGNLDIINSSDYQRSDALFKNIKRLFSNAGSDYGMVTGGGIFGTNDMSGISKTDVSPNAKWYAIDYSKYNTYMVETVEEAEELNQFMQKVNLAVIKNLGVDGKYIAPSFHDMYEDVDIEGLFQEYQQSFKGANLSLNEFKSVINELSERVKKAGFELYDDNDAKSSFTGKNAKVSDKHAYDEDISTMFYKKHGYEGVNFNKLKDQFYNSYMYGSTIFDIDKNSPYFKVFDTYEQAVEYMGQIRNKIDNNQAVFYDYVNKSNDKFQEKLEQTNKLLQEQSRLIDEIQGKLSHTELQEQSNKSNSPDSNSTTESQEKIQSELKETQNQAEITANSLKEIGNESNISSASESQIKIQNQVTESIQEQNKAIDESIKKTLTLNDVRQKQWEIIQKTNPKLEGTNSTWVDKPEDAKTFYEVNHKDSDYPFNENYSDDWTVKDKMNVEATGKITVYSSYPIEDGNWVTPSKEEGLSYAGSGKLYSATMDVRDIAWVDAGQGQVAHISDELKEVIDLSTKAETQVQSIDNKTNNVNNQSTLNVLDDTISKYETIVALVKEYYELSHNKQDIIGTSSDDERISEIRKQLKSYTQSPEYSGGYKMGIKGSGKNIFAKSVDLSQEEMLQEICNMLGVEIPQNAEKAKEAIKEVSTATTSADQMKDAFQGETGSGNAPKIKENLDEAIQEEVKAETQAIEQEEKAIEEATEAKKEFSTANEGVQSSIDDSKSPLQLEAELMDQIAKSAREAANAKKEFVEANKQVADSADESNSDLQTGHSENAEPTGVKKYKKRGYRAKSKGTQDNEIKVEGGKTLEQALRESQDKVKSGLNTNVDVIKEITDFYDSNDNLVKTQMKVINAETKRQSTYTTSYSTDKDGNATAWTSHIDTNKIADREKQEAKEIQAEWKKNTDAIEAYMNAVTKLNNLKTVDKGTGKYSNQIELQIQKVEELRQVAYAARANLSSMINPHDMDITDWNKWLEAMKQFGQASQGSAESVAKLEDALKNVKTSTLNSVQLTIDTYEQKLNDFSNTPTGFDQSTAYKNNIESLTNAINTLKTYKEQLVTQDTISNDDLNQIKEYEQDIEKATHAITSMSAAEKGSTNLGRDKLYNKIGDYLKRNSSMSEQFKQDLEDLQRQLTTLGGDANVSQLTDKFVKLQSRIREAKQEGKTFWDVIKEKAWYGLASQIGMYFGLNDFIRYIQQGISVVTELDTALTEMRKVSDETTQSLKNYQATTFDVADAVGTTAVQIQNSTADWMMVYPFVPLYGNV